MLPERQDQQQRNAQTESIISSNAPFLSTQPARPGSAFYLGRASTQHPAAFAQSLQRFPAQQQQQFRLAAGPPLHSAFQTVAGQPISTTPGPAAAHSAFLTAPALQAQQQHLGWGGQHLPQAQALTGFAVHVGPATSLGAAAVRGGSLGHRSPSQHSHEIIASLIQALSTSPAAAITDLLATALSQLDSRQAASLLRECGHRGGTLVTRAWEVFNWLRSIPPGSPFSHLRALLDVFTYTAMVSMCASSKDVNTAFELSREMEQRGVLLNVHTYSALMNVAVKAGRSQLARDTFQRMQQAGVQPNLVTFNTLIDVYGKLGLWADAIQVLSHMRDRGVEPVVRTYNTLMIACTLSNRWQEALQVYQRMLEAGLKPNTTTYNALISAYSKAGQLDNVMAVFSEMVDAGCERSVITYSTLIAACERVGQWETALQLFARMPSDGCQPNTITYNSLITACAQGMQWQLALQLFDQMVSEGHVPDVVSYTAFISACGKGCQWRRALQLFARMQAQGCQPDHIIYETIIDALWSTGIRVPQLRAVQLYRTAMQQGLMRQIEPPLRSGAPATPLVDPVTGSETTTEVSITSSNPVMLLLGLLMLLREYWERMAQQGPDAVPAALVVRMGSKGRARDTIMHRNLTAVMRGLLRTSRCPMQLTSDGYGGSMRVMCTRAQLAAWLMSPAADDLLGNLTINPAAGSSRTQLLGSSPPSAQEEAALQQEEARYASMEVWCVQAHHMIHSFEVAHRLAVAAMGPAYLDARGELLDKLAQVGDELQLPAERVYDALLLLDRAMGGGAQQVPTDQLWTALLAALLIVSKQAQPEPPLAGVGAGGVPSGMRLVATAAGTRLHGAGSTGTAGTAGFGQPVLGLSEDAVAQVSGISAVKLQGMQATLRARLAQGTAAVSAVHSLRMYHFCLGYSQGRIPPSGKLAVPMPMPVSPSHSSGAGSMAGAPSRISRSSGSGVLSPGADASAGPGAASGAGTAAAASGASRAPHSQQPRFGDFPEQGDTLVLPEIGYLSLAERPQAAAATAGATATEPGATAATASAEPPSREPSLPSQTGAAADATSPCAQLLPRLSQSSSVGGASRASAQLSSLPVGVASAAAVGVSLDDLELCSYQLMHLVIGSKESLNLRPSVVAAAALYGARMLHGELPLWPSALVHLTGGLDVTDPEMSTAISLVQRLGV